MSNAVANDSASNMEPHLAAHIARLASVPMFGSAQGYTYGADLGPKYARVWRAYQGAKSVVHFVDLATGEIRGAKSWQAAGAKTGRRIAVAVRVSP